MFQRESSLLFQSLTFLFLFLRIFFIAFLCTCCGIYICSHRLPRCPLVGCIWPFYQVLLPELCRQGTCACEEIQTVTFI